MFAKGAKARLLLIFEDTEGVIPTTPVGIRIPVNKVGLSSKTDSKSAETLTGDRNPISPIHGNVDVSGTIDVPLDVRVIGYILKWAFGTPVTTGTGPYVHTFKIGDTMPSATCEVGLLDVGSFHVFKGCKVSKLNFTIDGSGELVVSIDVLGMDRLLDNETLDTTPTNVSLGRIVSNQIASVLEGAVALSVSKSFSLSVDFGLDGDTYFLGAGGKRASVLPGLMDISGTLDTMFKDQTLVTKAMNHEETSLKVTGSTGAHSIEILLPELQFAEKLPSIDGPKGISCSLDFNAYYDNAVEASAVVIKITNDIASYT